MTPSRANLSKADRELLEAFEAEGRSAGEAAGRRWGQTAEPEAVLELAFGSSDWEDLKGQIAPDLKEGESSDEEFRKRIGCDPRYADWVIRDEFADGFAKGAIEHADQIALAALRDGLRGAAQAFDRNAAKRSILAVGPGRGFVVDIDDKLLVVTAAHRLPRLPDPGVGPRVIEELTFSKLLGRHCHTPQE
jgi:hypothetical protein